MSVRNTGFVTAALILLATMTAPLWSFSDTQAAQITLSGTVSYQGAYSGDTLFVAVLDTTDSGEDVNILEIQAFSVSAPPFNQAYSLTFDNAAVAGVLFIASLLDVDGDGTNSVSGDDVFGWYGEGMEPAGVSPATSQSGLDFALPRAEIRGTITFASGQTEARINFSPSSDCGMDGFRPNYDILSPGPYAVRGIYPGSYCVKADGQLPGGYEVICYGDVTCATPTAVTLTATEVKTGIDFDFNDVVPVERTTWGRIKSRYP